MSFWTNDSFWTNVNSKADKLEIGPPELPPRKRGRPARFFWKCWARISYRIQISLQTNLFWSFWHFGRLLRKALFAGRLRKSLPTAGEFVIQSCKRCTISKWIDSSMRFLQRWSQYITSGDRSTNSARKSFGMLWSKSTRKCKRVSQSPKMSTRANAASKNFHKTLAFSSSSKRR